MAKTFDGPPTLERSGSEHRRAVTSLALLERARAWVWVKDPPAGEGQVGHKQYRVGRLHPSFLRREGLVRMWSSLWLKGDGGIRKNSFFYGKK